jgi:hypothetical protein
MNILIDELFKLRLDVKIFSHDYIYITLFCNNHKENPVEIASKIFGDMLHLVSSCERWPVKILIVKENKKKRFGTRLGTHNIHL